MDGVNVPILARKKLMIPYFFLFSIPAVFSFISPDKESSSQKILFFFTSIIYIFFIGFRDEVGADWFAYVGMYDSISRSSFEEAINHTEPSYGLLNWLLAKANFDFYAVDFIAAIIFVSGLVKFAEKMPLPWLALTSVTPYLVIAVGMSGVRQAAAIGLVFHLMAGWGINSSFKNIVIALLATSFHYSAFIALLFVLQSMKMPTWLRWIILLAGGAVSFVIFTGTEQYTVYHTRYVTTNVVSPGALQHAALNVIPATIYLVFMDKWNNTYGKNNLMPLLSYLSLLSIAGVFISSTAFDRLALYLSPIQMLVYSTIPIVFKSQSYSIVIVVIHLVILFVWLKYSNTAFGYLPYKSIFF